MVWRRNATTIISSSGVSVVERGDLGPIGAFFTLFRLRHKRTVFGFKRRRAANTLALSSLFWIASRTDSVVRSPLCSRLPMTRSSYLYVSPSERCSESCLLVPLVHFITSAQLL